MNRFLIVLFVSFFPLMINAQSFSERRKADRERWYKEKEQAEFLKKHEADKKNNEIDHKTSAMALKERKFVLEADKIIFKYGSNVFVNSNTNFVSLCGDEAAVQIAPMNSHPGFNGLGGITLDGHASNINVTEDNKHNIRLTMNVMGVAISAQVQILLYEGSDEARVTITPNFNSNRIELTGRVVPFDESQVFKGTSI